MNATHILCPKENIAKIVLMPGDPLRAKYIAENFLEEPRLVNEIRNMLGYTGFYKGVKVTVLAHGMGCPSIGIYAYELYKFYDVEKIIRIGTCGALQKDIYVKDVILASNAYSISTFDVPIFKKHQDFYPASESLNAIIVETAKNTNTKLHIGDIYTGDVFDVYFDVSSILESFKKKFLAAEMEAFALFCLAKHLKKQAACLLTVVNSCYQEEEISAKDRESSLNDMIKLALESIIKDL